MREDAATTGWGDSFRPLTPSEFEKIRRMAYETCGLDLKPGKQALVAARLGKYLRNASFRTFEEYCRHVEQDTTGEALTAMMDALTTNYTSFFREPAHFEFLGRIWPELRGRDGLQLWSAACATGEEPYSIAMTLLELSGAASPPPRLLATDISTRALAVAQDGIYGAEKLQPVRRDWFAKYFLRGEGPRKGCYQVTPAVRSAVEFRRFNLIESPLPAGAFQVVFCRNVMIYFDKPTQERVIKRLAQTIEPGGYLFIGHAESLAGIDHPFSYVRPAIYRKKSSGWPPPGRSRPFGRVAWL